MRAIIALFTHSCQFRENNTHSFSMFQQYSDSWVTKLFQVNLVELLTKAQNCVTHSSALPTYRL